MDYTQFVTEVLPPKKRNKRVGRGIGSKRGKTSCRGANGAGARSGYKKRLGQEGGQNPLYLRMPTRGFTNKRHQTAVFSVNLSYLDRHFDENDTVSIKGLKEKKLIPKSKKQKLKILGAGKLTKNLVIEAHHYTNKAIEKLTEQKIQCNRVK